MGALIPAIISAVVGVGTAVYSSSEAKSSANKAREAQKKADLEARKIQSEAGKPLEATATLGFNDTEDTLSALDLIKIKPASDNNKNNSGVSSSNSWGLGF